MGQNGKIPKNFKENKKTTEFDRWFYLLISNYQLLAE